MVFAKSSWAADFYVAQNAIGDNSGSSCANAKPYTWFNTAGNWGAGDGKISAGDTVHICGTLSGSAGQQMLAFQGSGTSGNEITLKFEDDAKMSAPYWSTNGAIYANGKNYIIIDGGTNGIIEATDNGTTKTYKQDTVGVRLQNCTNSTVKNLTINNLYVRTMDSEDPNSYGTGVLFRHESTPPTTLGTMLVDNVHVTFAKFGIRWSGVVAGSFSGPLIVRNSVVSRCSISISANTYATGGSCILDGVQFYNNTVRDNAYWDSKGNYHHQDGIVVYSSQGDDDEIRNVKIYNNYIHGDMGYRCTCWIGLAGGTNGALVYNNLLVNDAPCESPTDAYIWMRDRDQYHDHNVEAYNNTVIGNPAAMKNCFAVEHTARGLTVKNNIAVNHRDFIYVASGQSNVIDNCTYNDKYNVIAWVSGDTDVCTGQAGNITSDPGLDSSYKPASSSSAVVDVGTNLSVHFTTDKDGVTRPQGSTWDIGAYEYVGAADTTPPSPPTGVTVQ